MPGTGESWQCHVCRQLPDCDECDSLGGNPTNVEECSKCGEMRHVSDLDSVLTYRATRDAPAEYDWICVDCIEREEGLRDHAIDQKIDERRDEGF